MSLRNTFTSATSTLFKVFDDVLNDIVIVEKNSTYDPTTSTLEESKTETTLRAKITPVVDINNTILDNQVDALIKTQDFPADFTGADFVVYDNLEYNIISYSNNGFVTTIRLEERSS